MHEHADIPHGFEVERPASMPRPMGSCEFKTEEIHPIADDIIFPDAAVEKLKTDAENFFPTAAAAKQKNFKTVQRQTLEERSLM